MRILLIFFLFVCSTNSLHSQVVINEVVSLNHTLLSDVDGDYEDWIELFNNSDQAVNLHGYVIKDNIKKPGWVFPRVVINPREYLLIFASGKNSLNIEELHTNFRIDSDGESLYIYNRRQNLIDSVAVAKLPSDVSYGRFPCGSDNWFYFMEPTPGKKNIIPFFEIRTDSISFSPAAGFYPTGIDISLKTDANDVEIRYTTNCEEPTINSKLYMGKIGIDSTTVIRAATFYQGIKTGPFLSASYLINAEHKLPVFSISGNPHGFFDYNEGILVEGPGASDESPRYGANYWKNIERPVFIEFFDEDRELQIYQNAGLKVFGGWSRMHEQKSMAIFARNHYGSNNFAYNFFKDKNHQQLKTFTLRNSGNDWTKTMIRDGFTSELVKDLNVDRLAFQPSIIYLNGEYWGILNIREKTNEHYIENNFAIAPDEVNCLEKNGSLIKGTKERFIELRSYLNKNETLEADYDYERVLSDIDIDAFIDYQLIQIYINNHDWPGNNIKFWNTNSPFSKYRWFLYDTDYGYALSNPEYYTYNTLVLATEPDKNTWPNPAWSTLILRRLLTNNQFKYMFINRMDDLMNTVFLPQNMNKVLDSLASLIEPEIDQHFSHWKSNYNDWNTELEIIKDFNRLRPEYVRKHFRDYFHISNSYKLTISTSNNSAGKVKINTVIYDDYPHQGTYFGDIPIQIEALPNPGYKFSRWENDHESINRNSVLRLRKNCNLHAVFEAVNEVVQHVVINEIEYSPSKDVDSGKWIELFNSGNQTVNLHNWSLTDNIGGELFIFNTEEILYPNELIVVCSEKEKFSQIHPNVRNVTGSFNFEIASSKGSISLYNNKSILIDQVSFEKRHPWPDQPGISSSTLVLVSPNLNNSSHLSWMSGIPGGTPGKANINTPDFCFESGSHSTTCFPSIITEYTTLRIFGKAQNDYRIKVYDLNGILHKTISGKFENDGTHYFDIDLSHGIKPNIYFLSITTQNKNEVLRILKQ